MNWFEAWSITKLAELQPRLEAALHHRQRGDIITQQAISIGVAVVVVGAILVTFYKIVGTALDNFVSGNIQRFQAAINPQGYPGGTFVIAPWRNPFQEPLSLVVAGEDVDRTQLFEVRRMLEAEAAALAAKRRSLGDLELMHEATDEMEAAVDSADVYIAADIRYHLVIAEATGNRLLLHLMQAIRERLTEMFGTVFKFPGGPERSIAQHRLITQAIAAEDAERARQAMTEHILRVEQELAQLDR